MASRLTLSIVRRANILYRNGVYRYTLPLDHETNVARSLHFEISESLFAKAQGPCLTIASAVLTDSQPLAHLDASQPTSWSFLVAEETPEPQLR